MKRIELTELSVKPFHLLDKEWALLVAGKDAPNPMTVSWGGLGTLWMRPVVTVYVRDSRHTYGLLNAHPEFTLNFMDAGAKEALNFCGTKSGRDFDKWAETGLEQEAAQTVAVPRVAGAKLAFECRVLSTADIDPARFLEPAIEKLYAAKDYHRVYFGEVLAAFQG